MVSSLNQWLQPTVGMVTSSTSAKYLEEGFSELFTHGAIKDKVDGVVEQSYDVEKIAKRNIDIFVKSSDENTAEREDTLRQFCY